MFRRGGPLYDRSSDQYGSAYGEKPKNDRGAKHYDPPLYDPPFLARAVRSFVAAAERMLGKRAA